MRKNQAQLACTTTFLFSYKLNFSLPSDLVCIPIVSAWRDCGMDNTDEI